MLAQEVARRRLRQFNRVIAVSPNPPDAAQSLRIDAVDTGEVTESNYQCFRKRLHDHAARNSKRQQKYE